MKCKLMSNFRFWNSLSLSLFWCLCVSSWLPCHIYAARSARCPRNRRIQQPEHALRPAPHVDAIRAAKAQGPCRERFTLLSLARSLDSLLAGAGSDMLVAATVISKIIYRFIVRRWDSLNKRAPRGRAKQRAGHKCAALALHCVCVRHCGGNFERDGHSCAESPQQCIVAL